MEKVLISACLLGARVRYHGGSAEMDDPILKRWVEEGRLVPVCPEVAGGLPTPRPAAEVQTSGDGRLRVVTVNGGDVSGPFAQGAETALALVREHRIRVAVLKDGSPSCGSSFIHDGTFSGTRVAGAGLTARRLSEAGVRVFSETQVAEAARWLQAVAREGARSA
jgi:uncharacterized protein YbbK (DUF523 family)